MNLDRSVLEKRLAQLPIRNDSVTLRRTKQEIEKKIIELDEAIQIFSKPKVFLKIDEWTRILIKRNTLNTGIFFLDLSHVRYAQRFLFQIGLNPSALSCNYSPRIFYPCVETTIGLLIRRRISFVFLYISCSTFFSSHPNVSK